MMPQVVSDYSLPLCLGLWLLTFSHHHLIEACCEDCRVHDPHANFVEERCWKEDLEEHLDFKSWSPPQAENRRE